MVCYDREYRQLLHRFTSLTKVTLWVRNIELSLYSALIGEIELAGTEHLFGQLFCTGNDRQCCVIAGPEPGSKDTRKVEVVCWRKPGRQVMPAQEAPVPDACRYKGDLALGMTNS